MYDKLTLATVDEIVEGIAAIQKLGAGCHVKATEAVARGDNEEAIAWQKAHAKYYRTVVDGYMPAFWRAIR